MRISKVRIKNYRSIKDSGEINLSDNLFVLAGQNESGKSSILEALNSFDSEELNQENLNFELENKENLMQEISCTFSDINEKQYQSLEKLLLDLSIKKNSDLIDTNLIKIIDIDDLKKIKDFTITKKFDFTNSDPKLIRTLDALTLGKLKGYIKNIKIEEVSEEDGTLRIEERRLLDIDNLEDDISFLFWTITPEIILFNDFTTLLPDKILLEDIENASIQGQAAVKNLESLLQISFTKISQKNTSQKISTTEAESKLLSVNFQKDWQQKIYGDNEVSIKFVIENTNAGKKEISFFIETKNNELLAPRKRSKGMIWFLSLWLELKAKENTGGLIMLFDEPGLHLHIKANKDMLSVFHKLIQKGHQIIYSTHSPSLIETDRLNNIGLVINTEDKGTLIEGLTTSKINTANKKDALQPIAEAMGIEPLKDFSVLKQKNVLLEGLSDFWYFKGMSKILKSNYEFIPGVGIKGNKIYHLISFCIGYGLDWLLIMDNGVIPNEVQQDLKNNLFHGDETELNNKIKLIQQTEIENMFSIKDLALIESSIKENSSKKPSEVIGEKRKIVFAKMFYEKVLNGDIKKDDLQSSTIDNFRNVFNWIETQFSTHTNHPQPEGVAIEISDDITKAS